MSTCPGVVSKTIYSQVSTSFHFYSKTEMLEQGKEVIGNKGVIALGKDPKQCLNPLLVNFALATKILMKESCRIIAVGCNNCLQSTSTH